MQWAIKQTLVTDSSSSFELTGICQLDLLQTPHPGVDCCTNSSRTSSQSVYMKDKKSSIWQD